MATIGLRTILVTIGLLIALIGTFIVAPARAQTPAPTPAPPSAPAPRVIRSGPALSALADALGMSELDLIRERRSGKSFADLAREKNVPEEQLVDAIAGPREDAIDRLARSEDLTRRQIDWMKETVRTQAHLLITNPFSGVGMGIQGMMGMMGVMGPFGDLTLFGDDFMGPSMRGWGWNGDDMERWFRDTPGNRGPLLDRFGPHPWSGRPKPPAPAP